LIEKQRAKMAQHKQAGAALNCPQCGKALAAGARGGVAMMACPDDHGAWLETTALKAIFDARK
ncbi:MAG: zf-TFIIB domain-containing protein, partial [Candidatus Binatales bacterium]